MPEATPKHVDCDNRSAAQLSGRKRARVATERLCALTRAERPVAELLRFVAAPDDTICPDIAGKLPGRGVWLTADKNTLRAAVKANAFARSLKRQVLPAAELPEIVEQLLVKRTTEALSLANKAGVLVTGFDKVSASIERGEVSALLHGFDAALGGRQKLDAKYKAVQAGAARNAVIVDCLKIDEMSLATGRPNVVHAALKSGGATQRFVAEADRLSRYRTGFASSDRETAVAGAPGQLSKPPLDTAMDNGKE